MVCVGAVKAATTSLHTLFSKHFQVCVSDQKEIGFFFNDELYANGYDWYLNRYFPKKDNDRRFLFEADPNYMYVDRCMGRIAQCNPSAKIIVMLLHLVDRAYSQYSMIKKWGFETLSFGGVCAVEHTRISESEWNCGHYGYLDRSRYSKQIEKCSACISTRTSLIRCI